MHSAVYMQRVRDRARTVDISMQRDCDILHAHVAKDGGKSVAAAVTNLTVTVSGNC